MHISQLVHQISERLQKSGIPTPIREARLVIQHALNIPYLTILTEPTYDLSLSQVEKALAWCERRAAREPLSKIIGLKEFWGLEFMVSPHTLDPRPDSETLIEAVLGYYPDKKRPLKILDLGTGSGCLILSLLWEYPHACGVAIDQSLHALDIALKNATRLNMMDRLTCQQGNWTDNLTESFDVIISNPPYIALGTPLEPEVENFDPHEALFAGCDGLDAYREIARDVARLMTADSHLFLEIGFDQDKSVEEIFLNNDFRKLEMKQDLANITRCLIFCKKVT